MSVDRLFSNPREMVRRAEKKIFDEVIDILKRSHGNPDDQPTPTSFYEDKIMFTLRMSSSLGGRSYAWLDIEKAMKVMGFEQPTLIDNGYAISYSIAITE